MDTPSSVMSTPGRITLYRGFPPSNRYTWSPFVTKLEFRLRVAGIPYQCLMGNPTEGPSGKVPYVDIPVLSGSRTGKKELVGDSAVIIQTLVRRGAMADLNEGLSAQERIADMGVTALFEEKLYFLQMAERWFENYYIQRDQILGSKPWLLKVIIGNLIYRKIVQTLHLQGCGRFSREEQRSSRHEIWQAIEEALKTLRPTVVAGDKETSKMPFWYLGGQHATAADATLFGFINSALIAESSPESRRFVRGLPAVMEYAHRIHDAYFPDYEKWQE